MEELYNELMEYLRNHMVELGLEGLDEDFGQLEALLNGEDTYPVTFPCLLIVLGEAQWADYKPTEGKQRGQMTVTTRLAFDCYDDTHAGAEQQEYAQERQRKARRLHRLLQGSAPHTCNGSAMSRTASRTITLPGGIKVYETDYKLRLSD